MPDTVNTRLATGPQAPAKARRLVHEVPMRQEARAKVELIVSELVTNSVMHGHEGEVVVSLERSGERLRGEVCGRGAHFSWASEEPDLSEPGGLGLLLVDRVADRWGIRQSSRVCVWFECVGCAAP